MGLRIEQAGEFVDLVAGELVEKDPKQGFVLASQKLGNQGSLVSGWEVEEHVHEGVNYLFVLPDSLLVDGSKGSAVPVDD